MSLSLRNLGWLRSLNLNGAPEFGARMSELFTDLQKGVNQIEQQGNFNANGAVGAPPPLQGLTVQSHENGFDIAIAHQGKFFRNAEYYIDYADNPAFTGARTQHVGESRNAILPLGSQRLYFRAWAKYAGGASTSPVTFGGSQPVAVQGGITTTLLPTQGCGTAQAGQVSWQQAPFTGNKIPPRT